MKYIFPLYPSCNIFKQRRKSPKFSFSQDKWEAFGGHVDAMPRQFIIVPGSQNQEFDFNGCVDREEAVVNNQQVPGYTEPDSEIEGEKEANMATPSSKLKCCLMKITSVLVMVLLQTVSVTYAVPHFWAYIRRCAEGRRKTGFSMYHFRDAVLICLLELYEKRADPLIKLNGRIIRDACYYWKLMTAPHGARQKEVTDAPQPPNAPNNNNNNPNAGEPLPVWTAKGDVPLLEEDENDPDPLLNHDRSLDPVGNKKGGCMCTRSDPYGPRPAGNEAMYDFVQFQSQNPDDYAQNGNYEPDIRSEEHKNESEPPGKSSAWSVTIVNKISSHLPNAWGILKVFFRLCKEYALHGTDNTYPSLTTSTPTHTPGSNYFYITFLRWWRDRDGGQEWTSALTMLYSLGSRLYQECDENEQAHHNNFEGDAGDCLRRSLR